MPLLLLPLVTWLSTALTQFFTVFFAAKAIKLFGLSVVIGLMGTAVFFFISTIDVQIGSIIPNSLNASLSFLPSNTPTCLAVMFTVKAACVSFRFVVWLINVKTSAMLS